MSRQDVLDLYDVQAYLSGELAARAAVNLTGDDQDRLDEIQDKLVAAVEAGDSVAVEEADFAVHQLINRAAAAPKLVWLLSLTLRYVPFSMYGHIKGWELAARDDHALIFRGLRNRSEQAAAEAMRAHIRNAGIIIANHLSEQGVITEQ
jgi:DNA-binding GntR family transcriptional regulator